MRIGYLGNFTRSFCTEVHVMQALQAEGHHVLRLQENRTQLGRLAKQLPTLRLDLLLWTRTWDVDTTLAMRLLQACRDQGIRTASFHLDRYLGLEREGLVDSEPFFRTELLFTPDPGDWGAHGVTAHWMPPGVEDVEASWEPAPNPQQWPWLVAMVGSYPYPHPGWHPYRDAVVQHLRGKWGDRFAVLPHELGRGRAIRGRELSELYATVPVLVGDSCWVGIEDHPELGAYWSDRVPETLGRGGYLIHPHSPQLKGRYPALATYPLGDLSKLDEEIELALDDPDWAHGQQALSRIQVRDQDTYRARMRELVETMSSDEEPMASFPPAGEQDGRVLGTFVVRGAPALVHSFQLPEGADEHEVLTVKEVWDRDDYRMAELGLRKAHVIDVGANVGAFSILAAHLGARAVDAYEPHPDTFQALKANVAASPAARKVATYPYAVGTADGIEPLAGAGGGAHLVHPGEPGLLVQVVDINAVLGGIQGDEVILKLDCEGSEFPILSAVTKENLAKVRTLVMEWHGPGMPHLTHLTTDSWGAMVTRLADHGRLRVEGHPSMGGLLWMWRFGQ